MKSIDLSLPMSAVFSDDGRYRYALTRIWSQARPPLLFIGLNPSQANQIRNDPTITRMIMRANNLGFGGLLAANLYAMISTDPGRLKWKDDTVGSDNDSYLAQLVDLAGGMALCGWGSFEAAKVRAPLVLAMIREPYCLGINADGQPKHPLYVGYDVEMVKMVYNTETEAAGGSRCQRKRNPS